MSQPSLPIRRSARIIAAAFALCAFALAGPALAQTATQPAPAAQPAQGTVAPNQIPIIVGVLDTQAILNASSAGKSLNTQWDAAMKALNDDMAKKENGLRAQAQQLEAARSGNPPIAPADYATKRKALEQQDIQFQQAFAKNKQAWDGRLNKARESIANAARKAMQDVAKARGLTLILDRAAVPYSPQPWNITDEVMTRLNKALPTVKL
ncbi:OmpH family outer membrane protein [Dongia sedimenti]|uniref:OmpH family outer membrane protein n=1 Tax=Dongia sedimenti TaxID=3064282 RepID=A0ABU0YK14_9PROT|nr:OmpH family outer membrane protein [Rhodospirillaceae bacterium R-7]